MAHLLAVRRPVVAEILVYLQLEEIGDAQELREGVRVNADWSCVDVVEDQGHDVGVDVGKDKDCWFRCFMGEKFLKQINSAVRIT